MVCPAAVQVAQNLEDGFGVLSVQIAGGLVGQENRRMIHDGAGDGDALLLAAGERVRFVVQALVDAEQAENLVELGPAGLASVPAMWRATAILSRAVRLGSRLNFWNTNPTVRLRSARAARHRSWPPGPDRATTHLPGGGWRQPADDVKQRRLAGAGRPTMERNSPGLHVEIHAAKRRHIHLADAIDLAQIAGFR